MVKSSDANPDMLPKHIGCMNGIFKLLDRRLLFAGGRHHNTVLAAGSQQGVQQPHNATKTVMENDPGESLDSSQAASYSSSSRSSTHSLNRVLQPHDIRDLVKDSMHRVKSLASNERVSLNMKHTNSPRRTKGERLVLPRFSYDGRESQDTQLKELPRFSLDSKPRSIKHSRLNSVSYDPQMEVPPGKKEFGSHSRSSSIVTKLMGLEDESSTIKSSPSPRMCSLSKSTATAKIKQVSPQKRQQCNPISVCKKRPVEAAPWKKTNNNKQDHFQKDLAGKARSRPSLSVYGEMEKRITELEFKRSGKDLRALKHILQSMQKTTNGSEPESHQLKLQDNSTQQPVLNIINETCHPNHLTSSTEIMNSNSTRILSYSQLENEARGERADYRTPINNDMKYPNKRFPSTSKNITPPKHIKVEKSTIYGKGGVSPRLQHILLKTERESHPNISTSESERARKQLSKKVRKKCAQNGRPGVKSMDRQLRNEQLSNLSSEKRRYASYHCDMAESNNGPETDANLNSTTRQVYMTTRKQCIPVAEVAVITMEKPSPVSVLDTASYSEGSPSPVQKISTAFQDESQSPDEAEQTLQNGNHLAASSGSSCRNNQNLKSNGETPYHSININKMLVAFGLLKDATIIQADNDNQCISLGGLSNSNIFHALQDNDQMKFNQRKIIAEVANELLVRKITSGRLFTMGRRSMSLQGLVKEVYLEMEHLCRMSYCSVDDEDDKSIRAVTVDMKYQSDEWTDYTGEAPALVLDLERLIFKELINEVITCELP